MELESLLGSIRTPTLSPLSDISRPSETMSPDCSSAESPFSQHRQEERAKSTTPPTPNSTSPGPSTIPTSVELRFRPLPDRNYAEDFALAVKEAYLNGTLVSGKESQLGWAERILQGEGSDLVFRRGYAETLRTKTWNGDDERVRRGAFLHILGTSTKDCEFQGCQWKEPGISAVCQPCQENRGHFEGCRHSHSEIGRNGNCSNCAANCTPANCTFSQKNREVSRKRKAGVASSSTRKRQRTDLDHLQLPSDELEMESRDVQGLPKVGPFTHLLHAHRRSEETPSQFLRRQNSLFTSQENPAILIAELFWMSHYVWYLAREVDTRRLSRFPEGLCKRASDAVKLLDTRVKDIVTSFQHKTEKQESDQG